MAEELRKAAREATGVGMTYEKTMKVDAAAYERTMKVEAVRDPLLDDLDTFVRRLDEEQQAELRAAEAERQRREQELRLAAEEARKRAAAEQQRVAQATAATAARRPSAFDALRKQGETKTVRPEDPAVARARELDGLDRELRAAYKYLAQFIGEVNSVNPQATGPYDVLYIGRLPVSLSDGWIDSRPRTIGGREYCDRVYLRYRVNPEPPARVTIFGPDIARCEQMMKSFGADYAMEVEVRTDFGEPRRATFTVKGKLPCELEIEADYAALTVAVELVNVRRPGKRKFRIAADKFKDVGDDLARYVLGVDDDFERFLT